MYYQWRDRTISLCDDLAFKAAFGRPEHSGLTLALLNSLMRQLKRPEFVSLQILNPFSMADFKGDKEISVDIYAEADQHQQFQVEMQVRTRPELPERFLDNWTRLYARQIGRGQDYQSHKPLLAVWFLVEGMPGNTEPVLVHTLRDQYNRELLGHQVLVLIDMAAWRRSLSRSCTGGILESGLVAWLMQFVGEGIRQLQDDDPVPVPGPVSETEKEIAQIMLSLLRDNKAWYRNESRRMARMDHAAFLRQAMAEGEAKGKLEGIVEGKLETAKAMKAEGIDVQVISRVTGLPVEEIQAL